MSALGATDLAGDVVAELTEVVYGAPLGEASAWRWITAEIPVFWYQGVAAVPLPAWGTEQNRHQKV